MQGLSSYTVTAPTISTWKGQTEPMTATTPEPEHRPSAAERHHELAMAAIQRTPQAPEHTVGLTLNAKGDVQIEVTGRGNDIDALVKSVQAHFDALRLAYPRGNGGDK